MDPLSSRPAVRPPSRLSGYAGRDQSHPRRARSLLLYTPSILAPVAFSQWSCRTGHLDLDLPLRLHSCCPPLSHPHTRLLFWLPWLPWLPYYLTSSPASCSRRLGPATATFSTCNGGPFAACDRMAPCSPSPLSVRGQVTCTESRQNAHAQRGRPR